MVRYLIKDKNNIKSIFRDAYYQAENLVNSGKEIELVLSETKSKRTTEQNKWLWAVYKHIVLFWTDTGFMPDNLDNKLKFINSDILHCWFKCRFDVKTTTKLSTEDIGKYIDKIQNLMVEQTDGEYEPIYP